MAVVGWPPVEAHASLFRSRLCKGAGRILLFLEVWSVAFELGLLDQVVGMLSWEREFHNLPVGHPVDLSNRFYTPRDGWSVGGRARFLFVLHW
jgi:hypothetical protein